MGLSLLVRNMRPFQIMRAEQITMPSDRGGGRGGTRRGGGGHPTKNPSGKMGQKIDISKTGQHRGEGCPIAHPPPDAEYVFFDWLASNPI